MEQKKQTSINSFIASFGKKDCLTENGALSNSSTGSDIADQFGKAGSARGRDVKEVFADMASLCANDLLEAVRFAFYLRMITRVDCLGNGEKTQKVQKGQGNRDESFKRFVYIAAYYPEVFYKNMWLIPVAGSWKDLWELMVMYDGIDRKKVFELMKRGLEDASQRDLVLKFMPTIETSKRCLTERKKLRVKYAKEFANFLGLDKRGYSRLKASGSAHAFQRDICQRNFNGLDFSKIPGRALFLLAGNKSDFLSKHNLEKRYLEWIKEQPVAKFTGYAYDLVRAVRRISGFYGTKNLSLAQKYTFDKQFDGLVELGRQSMGGGIKGNVMVCLDTSGSMGCLIGNVATDLCCSDIANGLALYFSALNTGAFNRCILSFDNTSKFYKLKGTFTDMLFHLPYVGSGGTNFQGVADEMVRVRKMYPEIPLEDYPETFLVVSDMQFNPAGRWIAPTEETIRTNYEELKVKFSEAFPKEYVDNLKFIWWNVRATTEDFPSTIEDAGTYNFSGFDGAIVSLLLGGDVETKVDEVTGKKVMPTMEEIIDAALTQEVLSKIRI